jgi:hypothetical protein
VVRHSSIAELADTKKAWQSLRSQGMRPDGYGMDYRLFRIVPASPPVAKLLRRYVTLREALLRLRAESADLRPDMKPSIREGCSAALAGLGSYPWNYEAAERSLHKWYLGILRANGFPEEKPQPSFGDDRPQVAAAAELRIYIAELIIAYADPHRFFQKVAPERHSDDFNANVLSNRLGRTLWRWGFGALLNDDVRRAFDSATPSQMIEILGFAEGRERYREGNPPGQGKGKPKKKRVDSVGTMVQAATRATEIEKNERLERGGMKRAIEEIAKAEKRSPAAIRKRITRARNK